MLFHTVWWMVEQPILEMHSAQSSIQTSIWSINWSTCKMNNAVPLILHPFHPKGKMLCCTGHLNWTVLSCSRNLGFKRPDLKIWKNVVMDYFNAPSFNLTWGNEEHLPVTWHIWSIQDQIMFCFNYHSCPTFLTFHEFIALEFNCVNVQDLHNTNQHSIYINCAIYITHTK
jgi:hypothetical protein